MRVSERKNSCIVGKTGFVNSMFIVGRMNRLGFLDSTRIAAAMIVYLHFAISVSWSPITRPEL